VADGALILKVLEIQENGVTGECIWDAMQLAARYRIIEIWSGTSRVHEHDCQYDSLHFTPLH
jgi:hypothetical protein